MRATFSSARPNAVPLPSHSRDAAFRLGVRRLSWHPTPQTMGVSLIRLSVLGTLRAERDQQGGADDLISQPKAVALLVYLALARPSGFHQRDRLVGLFWPELDQEHARASLRKLLQRLRRLAGEDVIETRGAESIAVNPQSVWCDAIEMQKAIAEDRLREALDLYRGELLPGFFIPGCGDFDHWLEEERAFYGERAVWTAWELVQRYVHHQELTNASQLARVVARLAPTDERMLRRVVTMLAKLGDRAGAMQIYSRFSERLWKDLETKPSAETVQLVERIQNNVPV
jgi:DNA-binding SARP family transcriptional activator